jgi:hypothetical protein
MMGSDAAINEAFNKPAEGPVGWPPGTPTAIGQEEPGANSENSTSGRGGRGRGQGRGRGRSRGRGYRGRNNRARAETPAPQTFFRNTDGMKGNVFQCHGESANKQQLLKTVGVLEEHINKTFTYPQDVTSVCRTLELEKLTQPPNLLKVEYDDNMGKRMIWETTMKSYIKRTEMMESNVRGI